MQNLNLNLNETLQVKYPHLQISIFNFKKVSTHLIFGAEFNSSARATALQTLNLNSNTNKTISDYFDLINTTISSVKEPVYVYDLTHSLGNFMCDVELSNDNLASSKKEVFAGYFVISRLRSYLQEMAVIQPKNFRQLLSTEYLVYRAKTDLLSANTLMAFALTREVQTILNHSQYGTEHPRFYEFVLNEMPIPNVLLELNDEIDLMMKQAYQILESSKMFYKEAEKLLYEALGLNLNNPLESLQPTCHTERSEVSQHYDNRDSSLFTKAQNDNIECIATKYPHLNISIRSLSQSYGISGRLDSEYYQSKYDTIERKIKSYQGGHCKLQDIGFFTNGSFILENLYTQKAKRAYIRIKELSFNAPIRIQECIYIDDKFEATNETMVKQNDFVIATIGNTIGKINLIPKELSGSFISNNTSRFRLTDESIIPEFLELLLRNFIVQEQIQREFTQTAQPKISNTSLENILIPKIDSTTQEQIALKIQKSFALRKESKDLLDSAKAKVENAIEKA